MGTIEGALHRPGSAPATAPVESYGLFLNAGAPTGATLAGVAEKGALLSDTTNGVLYINTGTKASPAWAPVGAQT